MSKKLLRMNISSFFMRSIFMVYNAPAKVAQKKHFAVISSLLSPPFVPGTYACAIMNRRKFTDELSCLSR